MATQETVKQITQGGVTRDVEDTTARQAIALINAAIDALTGTNDTTAAINTMNEVIAFLSGVTNNETLSGKLTELQSLISAKYTKPSSGIPASDLVSDVQTILNDVANKVDKNGTDSLMTAAEHTKLAGIAEGAQVNVINSISVNDTPVTPTNGNVNIEVEGAAGEDGITPHIGSNGNWWIGDTDTNVKAQGPAGSVTITDGDIDTLEVHNALNAYTGLLGMSGAMKLKSNIDAVQANLVKLYNKLANMAFWDAEDQAYAEPIPTLLDWSLPKKTITLDKALLDSNSIITDSSDNEITGTTVQVDEGGSFTFKIKPKANYALTAASASVSGTTIPPDSTTGGIYTFTVPSVTSDITVVLSSTALANRTVTIDNQVGVGIVIKKDGTPLSGTTVTVASGGNLTLTVEAAEYYSINSLDAKVNNVSLNPTESSGVYTISASNISSDITIVITGSTTYSGWFVAPKGDTAEVYGIQIDASINSTTGQAVADRTQKTILCPRCTSTNLQSYNASAGDSPEYFYAVNGNTFQLKMKPLVSGCYALNIAYYASDYSFISRDSYKDVGTNENWETSFNLPVNTAYVKVLVCRRDSYGGTVQEIQTIYDSWDDTTMQYK